MSDTSSDLLTLAESLVSFGRKKGADQIQVSIGRGNEFSVDVRKGEIERLVDAGSKALSVKVIKDQKVATASSSDFSLETLHRLVERTVRRAELASADPFAGLPEKEEKSVDIDALQLFDPSLAELSPDQKIQLALRTEELCLRDSRVRNSHGAGFSNYTGESFLANSEGFSGAYMQSHVNLGVYLQAGENDNLVQDGWYESSRFYASLPGPEEIARIATERVTRLIGAKKVVTQNVPVIFEPHMSGELLGFVFACANGGAVYRKQSFLADKLGEKIGSELFTVIDDGVLPAALGTKPFDREGVPARTTTVFEKGVFSQYLMDTYSARKLGRKSTGNASGANNFYLCAGEDSPEQIIATVENGLLLTGTMGQGFNPVTGDISRGAFGMWIEHGEIAYPVAEITISGNLAAMMRSVEAVGDDLRFNRNITGPTIKIAEMTVAGT